MGRGRVMPAQQTRFMTGIVAGLIVARSSRNPVSYTHLDVYKRQERSRPTSIGPITLAPPSSISILVEIEAEWYAGMISTLAGPDRRQNG